MSPKWLRRGAASAAAVAVSLLVACPPGTAEEVEVSFGLACRVRSVIDVDELLGSSATVDAPARVRPGERFSYRIQTAPVAYPDSSRGATTRSVSRLKNDFAIPANATFVDAAVVPGTAFNLDNVPPGVLRVNEDGVPDPAGTILRLSGNNEVIGNSPTSGTEGEAGIRAPKTQLQLDGTPSPVGDSWFRLPAVEVTMIAGDAGVITPMLRTAGAAGLVDDDANYNTSLTQATFLGSTQWGPTRCSPRDTMTGPLNAGAGPLAVITISDVAEVPATVTVDAPDVVDDGTVVTLTATVSPDVEGGTVLFRDGGTDLGEPVAVVDGRAAVEHRLSGAGSHTITAVYSGAPGAAGATSEPVAVTVPGSGNARGWWIAAGVGAIAGVLAVAVLARRRRR